MLFVTVGYFVFLLTVVVLFYGIRPSYRRDLLLLASYFFYASWNWKFLPLLLGLTSIDYAAALWIEKSEGRVRRLALTASLVANLGFLGVFKYYNFLGDNLAWLLGRPAGSFFADIVLPLGISFHTFQSISYVVDVYRGVQEPTRSFIDYALFIAFFPQLVAGPIVRAGTFFRDLYHWRYPSATEISRGAWLLVLGLTKKLVLADNFAIVADAYFAAVAKHPGLLSAWGGAISFAIEIYFDFSGYSDMAIGSALLLGFHFPVNFRQPFLAVSITDFWRRWHISLSSWLRDYLYISLGGNRRGKWKSYRNLVLTMLLGGLWHGARWGFLAWGAFNGVLLAIERATGFDRTREIPLRARDIPAALATFAAFCIGVVFVRANSLGDAFVVIAGMFSGPLGAWPIDPALLVLLAVSLLVALLEDRGLVQPFIERRSWYTLACLIGALLFVVEVLGQHSHRPFYYFQF
jgi:D-alanyl-lipoteichoic acid acyltransferase DltB (MBOAT superfamily)